MLAPQDVPFELFPEGRQVETPVAQETVPTLQGSVGWQVFPAAHAPQLPLLHTLSVPHDVPFSTDSPVSMQLTADVQTVLPARQGLAGTHERPGLQTTQTPPLQTFPFSQGEPSGAFPISRHSGTPVLQTVIPIRS